MLNKLIKKYNEYKDKKENTPCEVCRCYGVSNKDILDAINNGCSGISDVRKATKAGTACGRCNSSVEGHVSRALKK